MTRWLSDEWCRETGDLASELVGSPALSARIQIEVTGGPEGDVSYHRVVEEGRLVATSLGRIEHPDLTLTVDWDDARELNTGAVDPSVAFMRGRMKVAGSMASLVDVLRLTATPEYRDLRRRSVERTQF